VRAVELSTLGRSEARVRANLDAVFATLCVVCNRPLPDGFERPASAAFFQGECALFANINVLLGSSEHSIRCGSWSRCPARL
jgi:pyruvate kinase